VLHIVDQKCTHALALCAEINVNTAAVLAVLVSMLKDVCEVAGSEDIDDDDDEWASKHTHCGRRR